MLTSHVTKMNYFFKLIHFSSIIFKKNVKLYIKIKVLINKNFEINSFSYNLNKKNNNSFNCF